MLLHLDGEALRECQLPARILWSEGKSMYYLICCTTYFTYFTKTLAEAMITINNKETVKFTILFSTLNWTHSLDSEIITNLSCSDDLPVKQLFFILLIATSVPRHFP